MAGSEKASSRQLVNRGYPRPTNEISATMILMVTLPL
jgi:hypothetical protein